MPRFYGLRLSLGHRDYHDHRSSAAASTASGVSNRASTRSQGTTASPQQQQRQQQRRHDSVKLHPRGGTVTPYSSQWYGNEEASKRARGEEVAGAALHRSLGASEMGSDVQSPTTFCDSPLESVYSISSPRTPLPERLSRRTSPAARGEGEEEICGSGYSLCFDEEDERPHRLFSATRQQVQRSSSNVSVESEPVDIPGAGQAERDAGLEEEGWVALWSTYNRLFYDTCTGCSPPTPHSKTPTSSGIFQIVAAEAHHSRRTNNNGVSWPDQEALDGSWFWGHLSRLPLAEAEERLEAISGKFYRPPEKISLDLEDFCDDSSEPDLESSGGLMFDLEI